ncbi:hypothetical protein ACFY93_31450 [Streptomyces sp. NPDC008313]|uniref:hypothetical protein n=1 Tax=Streptomyces sp. NPDC008313 TaxID=3364826 RepID=UPI0036E49E55
MSVYVTVRGWVEFARDDLTRVKEIVAKSSDGHYSGGWGFPGKSVNWTSFAFYGGDLQEGDVSWLYDQLVEIAALPNSGEDDFGVQGLFLVTAEMGGMVEWQIRGGAVYVVNSDERHQYLGPF